MSDPKYIDAEKLKRHYAWWDDEAKKIFDEIIDQQPAADVVEVVRCKDCKHYNAGFECLIEGYGIERDKDWFCADAERRTDG